MDRLLNELKAFIEEARKNNDQSTPFLTDFEEGCMEGSHTIIDDLERIVNKYS